MDSLLNFVGLLQKYRTIERRIFVNGTNRNETDPEHSFSLAMLAWYIASTKKLNLDLEKLLVYALIHDLVEVYAGDTPFYNTDEETRLRKEKAEAAAAKQIKNEFVEFPELHDAIEQYEKKSDDESLFIYALDKLEPALNIYLDEGRSWKRDSVTLEKFKELKRPKVSEDNVVSTFLEKLISKMEEKHDHLFIDKR